MSEQEPNGIGERGRVRSKPRAVWIAVAAIFVFVVALALVVIRPIVDRRDGAEREIGSVNQAAVKQAGP